MNKQDTWMEVVFFLAAALIGGWLGCIYYTAQKVVA